MKLQWLGNVACLLVCCLPPRTAQAQEKTGPCALINARSDITLKLTLKGGQSIYHEGEIIPVELAFTASTKGNFGINTQSPSRGGLRLDSFCVDPVGRDPLEDYFESGIWAGGGCCGGSGFLPLDGAPRVFAAELNEWKSLPPGNYTLRVVSYRVYPAGGSGLPAMSIPIASNAVTFQVVAAAPEWRAEQLARALSVLDAKHQDLTDDEFKQIQQAMRVLRFLGSEAATRELARRFWSHDQPRRPPQLEHSAPYPDYWQFVLDTSFWDFEFGLIGSPYRAVAIQELTAAVNDSQHRATREMMQTLALLEIQSNSEYTRLLPYDSRHVAEWEKQHKAKAAAYNDIVAKLLKQVDK
jgi:hypothetical protein